LGFRFIAHDSEHTLPAGDIAIDRTGPFGGRQNGFGLQQPQYISNSSRRMAEFRLRSMTTSINIISTRPVNAAAVDRSFSQTDGELDRRVVGESARWGDAQREPAAEAHGLAECLHDVLNNWIPRRSATNTSSIAIRVGTRTSLRDI